MCYINKGISIGIAQAGVNAQEAVYIMFCTSSQLLITLAHTQNDLIKQERVYLQIYCICNIV